MTFKFTGKPFIDKITVPQYNELPCLRSSAIKDFMKSPAHYRYSQLNPDFDSGAKHLVLGSYVHALLLEPDTVNDQFIVVDMKTRHNKEYHAAAAVAQRTGKSVLLTEEKLDAERMVESCHNDPYVMELLNESFPEVSAAAKIGDVWLKCRMDAYIPERRTMVDIKTTGESIYWVENNIRRWQYDISAPLYMDVLNTAAADTGDAGHGADTYLFIFIEKSAPFGVKIFEMSSEYLADGRTRYMNALPQFRKCLAENVWPGYDNSVRTLLYPRNKVDSLSPNERPATS